MCGKDGIGKATLSILSILRDRQVKIISNLPYTLVLLLYSFSQYQSIDAG